MSSISRPSLPSICSGLKALSGLEHRGDARPQLGQGLLGVFRRLGHLGAGQPGGLSSANRQAICTWRLNGSMSGIMRVPMRTASSTFLAAAQAEPFSSTLEMAPSWR